MQLSKHRRIVGSLLSLLICCALIVEIAGVLHDNGIALFGFVDTIAGRNDCLGDTHVGCFGMARE